MKHKYPEYKQLNLTEIAQNVKKSWQEEDVFEKSISNREGKTPFVFYEGPPSANGMPGIHHVISRTLKDLVCRYKTMQGFQVKRKGGWDTHGLPVELGVEKLLGITKEDIGKSISVEEYNATCRREVLKFKDKWDEVTQKMGYWVDLKHPYITFENNYIETLWWCLKELYKKGYLYESVSIQPYSPAAGTGLSSHELNQPGTYKDVKDTSATVMFKVEKNEKSKFLFDEVELKSSTNYYSHEIFFLAWTTTPWTLPSNLGLTVGPNIEYFLVWTINPATHIPCNVIVAKNLFKKYFAFDKRSKGNNSSELFIGDYSFNSDMFLTRADIDPEDFETLPEDFDLTNKENVFDKKENKIIYWKILAGFKGKYLEGISYEQLMPSEANSLEKIQEITPGAEPFKVVLGDFVTTEDGTGIVHTAPAFGADDFKAGKKYNLGILTLVDREGKFIDGVGEFSGRFVKDYKDDPHYTDVNVDISVKLKKENRAFKVEKYEHNYPHCWRTDKPVIYYPLDAWFIKTTAVKDRMVELNKTINWKPASTGTGRFGNWLENMVDWNLSRSRFWGTPLPIWKTLAHFSPFKKPDIDDLGQFDQVVVGNKEELISNISEAKWEVKGYIVDFNRLTVDLRNESKILFDKISKYNIGLESEHIPFYQLDISQLRNIVSNRHINSDDLKQLIFPIEILEHYLKPINKEISDQIDFHKPYIDNIIFIRTEMSGRDFVYVRVPDLIDVWFDSGAMPYAQWHFPFENKEQFEKSFPADFIAEGVDQTRGWFYTLHALAVLLFDSVAYKTVVSNGLVLDKNGNKMSKRVGNVVDPFETLEVFGPDATRWYLITNASPWDNLKFDTEGIKEVQRKFFGTLYNTYQFFALYANVDAFIFGKDSIPINERPELDQWIISSLNSLIKEVTAALNDYEPTQAGRAIEYFLDEHLSNWYVRLSRRRFWKPADKNTPEGENDKISAYQTLYRCLEALSGLIAPIAPFFADWLFNNLNSVTKKNKAESVHLTNFPTHDDALINEPLEERMQLAQDISSLILSLRKKVNIKVRQPLQKVIVPAIDADFEKKISQVENIIKSETNIKEVDILPSDNNFIKKKAKANFKTLGKKLGARMKWAAAAIQELDDSSINKIQEGDYVLNPHEDEPIIISAEDIEVSTNEIPGFEIAVKGSLTVALDLEISDQLKKEGFAREFINRIQNLRKEKDFELTDKILLKVQEKEGIKDIITEFNEYICAEILAEKIEFLPKISDGEDIDVNNDTFTVKITKKSY